MSAPTVDAAANFPRRWSASALPWLCSTTVHAAVALAFQWHRDILPAGGDALGLNVTFVSPTESVDTATVEPVDLGADAGEKWYYDDEPPPSPPSIDALAASGARASSTSLQALLNEKPAVNLGGILPSSAGEVESSAEEPAASGADDTAGRGRSSPGRLSNRLRGGEARTSLFGAVGEGRKFVYVFDRSGSMDGHSGAPLRAAKDELIASLRDLGQTHQFQIIFYNEHPRIFNPTGTQGRLVFGNEQNKYLAQKFVGSITADGATRHEEALELALRLSPDVIFFLTDADEPRLTAEQLARIARLNSGTAIHAIEFGYGALSDADNFLVKLARQNGGQHVYVDVSRLTARP